MPLVVCFLSFGHTSTWSSVDTNQPSLIGLPQKSNSCDRRPELVPKRDIDTLSGLDNLVRILPDISSIIFRLQDGADSSLRDSHYGYTLTATPSQQPRTD